MSSSTHWYTRTIADDLHNNIGMSKCDSQSKISETMLQIGVFRESVRLTYKLRESEGDDPRSPCVREDCRYYTKRTQDVYCCQTCHQTEHTNNFIFSLANVPAQIETHTQMAPDLPGFEMVTTPAPDSPTSSAPAQPEVTSSVPAQPQRTSSPKPTTSVSGVSASEQVATTGAGSANAQATSPRITTTGQPPPPPPSPSSLPPPPPPNQAESAAQSNTGTVHPSDITTTTTTTTTTPRVVVTPSMVKVGGGVASAPGAQQTLLAIDVNKSTNDVINSASDITPNIPGLPARASEVVGQTTTSASTSGGSAGDVAHGHGSLNSKPPSISGQLATDSHPLDTSTPAAKSLTAKDSSVPVLTTAPPGEHPPDKRGTISNTGARNSHTGSASNSRAASTNTPPTTTSTPPTTTPTPPRVTTGSAPETEITRVQTATPTGAITPTARKPTTEASAVRGAPTLPTTSPTPTTNSAKTEAFPSLDGQLSGPRDAEKRVLPEPSLVQNLLGRGSEPNSLSTSGQIVTSSVSTGQLPSNSVVTAAGADYSGTSRHWTFRRQNIHVFSPDKATCHPQRKSHDFAHNVDCSSDNDIVCFIFSTSYSLNNIVWCIFNTSYSPNIGWFICITRYSPNIVWFIRNTSYSPNNIVWFIRNTSYSPNIVWFIRTTSYRPHNIVWFIRTTSYRPHNIVWFICNTSYSPNNIVWFICTTSYSPNNIVWFICNTSYSPNIVWFIRTTSYSPNIVWFIRTTSYSPNIVWFICTTSYRPNIVWFICTTSYRPNIVWFI
ncbi:hypothetical protein BaRGS_00005880, partial [Batillaria attramentaria]